MNPFVKLWCIISGRRNLDMLLHDMHNILEDLADVAEDHRMQAERASEAAAELLLQKAEHLNNSKRALRIADRVSTFME